MLFDFKDKNMSMESRECILDFIEGSGECGSDEILQSYRVQQLGDVEVGILFGHNVKGLIPDIVKYKVSVRGELKHKLIDYSRIFGFPLAKVLTPENDAGYKNMGDYVSRELRDDEAHLLKKIKQFLSDARIYAFNKSLLEGGGALSGVYEYEYTVEDRKGEICGEVSLFCEEAERIVDIAVSDRFVDFLLVRLNESYMRLISSLVRSYH